MKHNDTVKSTGQIGRHWSNVTPRKFWPMPRNRSISYYQKYLKNAFYAWEFYFAWLNLQRRARLHNIDRLSHDTAFWNIHSYTPKINIWRGSRFFHFILVSVLAIFNAIAYDILRFTAKMVITIWTYIKLSNPIRRVFVYTCQLVRRYRSNCFSIVHRRRTSWPFPGCLTTIKTQESSNDVFAYILF